MNSEHSLFNNIIKFSLFYMSTTIGVNIVCINIILL